MATCAQACHQGGVANCTCMAACDTTACDVDTTARIKDYIDSGCKDNNEDNQQTSTQHDNGPPACMAECAYACGRADGVTNCTCMAGCNTTACDEGTRLGIEGWVAGGCQDGDGDEDEGVLFVCCSFLSSSAMHMRLVMMDTL